MAHPQLKKQLTQQQYFDLQNQFEQTPSLDDGNMASGEHYQLIYLLKNMGYITHSRDEALNVAEELLSHGYRTA